MKMYLSPERNILNIPLKIKSDKLKNDGSMPERIEKVYDFLCKRYNVEPDGVMFGSDGTDIYDHKTTMLLTFKVKCTPLL